MIKNLLTVLSGDLSAQAIGIGITFVLAKKLSVDSFGVYNYILTLLGMLTIIVVPFANVYLRDHRYYQFQKYNGSYAWISLVLAPIFYLVICCCVYPLSWYVFIAFFIDFVALSVGYNYFNVHELYNNYSILNLLHQASKLLVLLFVLFVLRIERIDVIISSVYIVSAIPLISYIALKVDIKTITVKINLTFLKTMYGDSFYLVLYWSILPIMSFLGMFFIEKYINEYELGLYAFSLKLYAISIAALTPMLTVLRIRQIDIARKNEFKVFFKRNIRKVILFATGFYLLSILGAFILTFIFFQEYKASIGATVILITTSFFSYLTTPFSFLAAFRKYKAIFLLSLISLMLVIGINYYLIPVYGIIAAALSNFVAHSFLNTAGAILSYRYSNDGSQKAIV